MLEAFSQFFEHFEIKWPKKIWNTLSQGTKENLEGYGHLIDGPHERSCENGNFEIKGRARLSPDFDVWFSSSLTQNAIQVDMIIGGILGNLGFGI